MGRLDIDPASWGALDRLLDQALDRPPSERLAWVETLGDEFAALKPQLRTLLEQAVSVETGDFLKTLPKFQPAEEPAAPEMNPGETVGGYRLVRALGSGGMGSVWLAERADGLIQRPVALKLPHVVGARQAGLAERMARERDILAALDHRNIARLLDAGITPAGQPFLALEYVEGLPIDVYCARESARLDIAGRLRLFRQVVDAVAYAHGKLVLHRDLKPANILVTPAGSVKLLDFGIAKLLAEGQATETRLTEVSGRALTPDYASPEQILGEPLTVASDLYSLGVILFELLAGQRPYKLKRDSRGALEDAILRGEVPRPSQVAPAERQRALRGDLDTIALKALKRVPAERYATANALAEDVTRHLERRPVLAQPDSGWYRLRKFVARNRAGVAATATVLAAILVGTGVAVWQAVEASAQRDTALRHQRRAETYSDFMSVLLQDAGGGQAGRPLTPMELFDRGVKMLENQTHLDDSESAHLWYELSRNYLLFVNAKRELELLDRAIAGAEVAGDLELQAAATCASAWTIVHGTGDVSAAAERFARGRAALDRLAQPADYAVIDCLRAEARLLQAEGKIEPAIGLIQRGRARLASSGVTIDWRNDVLRTQLSSLYRASERFRDSLALSEESLAAIRESGRAGSFAELVQLNNHAGNLCRLGEVRRCGEIYEEILQWAVTSETPENPILGLRSNAGFTLLRLGQAERALELANHDGELSRKHGNPSALAMSDLLASRALLELGRPADARERLANAEAFWNRSPTEFRRMLVEAELVRGQIEFASGDLAAARVRATSLLESLGYPGDLTQAGLDRALRLAGQVDLAAGDHASARAYADHLLDISSRLSRERDTSADVGLAALLRAEALDRAGERDAARDALRLATAALTMGYGADHADTIRARELEREWGLQGS